MFCPNCDLSGCEAREIDGSLGLAGWDKRAPSNPNDNESLNGGFSLDDAENSCSQVKVGRIKERSDAALVVS
ncbi:MAG: hypothetical protein Aurels2KO_15630 [Aureliella sp.]